MGPLTAAYKAGDVIGRRYEIHRELGKGGMGVAYLAKDLDDGSAVALKTFKDKSVLNPAVKEQFRREALVWVSLGSHAFILQARQVHEFDGRPFVVMEYIPPDEDGLVTLLDHIIHRGTNMNVPMVGTWGIQFCVGMEYANSKGVTAHRDIKPANVLIGPGAFLKIADFGLAASLELPNDALANTEVENVNGLSLIRVGGKTVCGTPGYIAPEVFRGEGATVRSDLYSFGITLWQMCTGSEMPPFLAKHHGSFRRFMEGTYELQMKAPIPGAHTAFSSVIARCLAPDPEKRYANFADLRESIKEAHAKAGGRKMDFIVNTRKSFSDLVNQGASFRALGEVQRALDCYEQAIALEPDNPAPWVNKGNALWDMARLAEAAAAYDKAIELDRACQPAWFAKGVFLRDCGDPSAALQCFETLLSINERHALAWVSKGRLLAAEKRFQTAMQCYKKALEIRPQDEAAWIELGQAHHEIGEYKLADSCFDRAISSNQKSISAWLSKGELLGRVGQFEEGLRCLDMVLSIWPAESRALNAKATILCQVGKQQEAIRIFDRLLAQDAAASAVVWTNKGNALFELDSTKEALHCFDTALKLDPNYLHAWVQRARLMERTAHPEETLRSYLRANEIGPEIPEYWFGIGSALMMLGKISEAVTWFDKVLAKEPDHTKVLFNKGVALAQRREQFPEALRCFQLATKYDPDYVKGWYVRAHLERVMGRHSDAIRSCRALLHVAGSEHAEERKNAEQWLAELERASGLRSH